MSFFKKNLKKIIIITIIMVIIGLIIKSNIDKATASTRFNSKTQTIVNPKKETIIDAIKLTGSVNAISKADLHFQTSGQLNWVGVKVGDKVKKYQAIASLNKDILQKQLTIDFNNYKSTASTFYDTTDKYKDSVLTDDLRRILERNQNTLNNSVINYEIQDLTIKYATLITPIAGVVVAVDNPNSGVNVMATDNIATVVDPKSIYFYAKIDQSDVTKIKVGDKAIVKLDSFSDKSFDSQINYIAFTPVTGESSTVYEIRFNLPQEDNTDLKYRLGMNGDVSIPLKTDDNALTIPVDATHQDGDQIYVLVKNSNNNNLTKKYIKTGIETDTTIEILEGLSDNDQIVTTK